MFLNYCFLSFLILLAFDYVVVFSVLGVAVVVDAANISAVAAAVNKVCVCVISVLARVYQVCSDDVDGDDNGLV